MHFQCKSDCSNRSDFTDGNSTPLNECIVNSFTHLFDYLISLDDINLNLINSQNETPLISAAHENQPAFIQKLLQTDKVDINARDESGMSALFYCIKNGDLESIDLLISKKALIEYGDMSALHIAAENENPEILKHIIANQGIDLDRKDSEGKTALHLCANSSSNLVDNAKILIENGANVNAVDNMGSTPLHYAVGNENVDMVKFLISIPSIDTKIVDKSGWTPARIAELQGGEDSELFQLLK